MSVENCFENMISKLSCEKKKRIKYILASALITGVFSYFLFMVFGYTCPDGIVEGLHYYTNADWALANGRWITRYINYFIGHNIVIPFVVVILYCLLIGLSVLFISEIFNINKIVHLVLASSIMIASPCIITQLTYTYMALSYALAFFCSVLYCYFVRKGGICNVWGIVFLLVAMGSYQSYIGSAVLLIILIFIYELLSEYPILSLLKQFVRYCYTGVCACVIDIIVYKAEIYLRGTYEADRVASFNIKAIVSSLDVSFKKAYNVFFEYFMDDMLGRKYFYMAILICLAIILMRLIIDQMQKKQYLKTVIAVICILFIPVAANFIGVLVPYRSVYILMCYHYVLVVPFIFAVLERLSSERSKLIIDGGVSVCVYLLVSTYVLSANASFKCWKISYDVIKAQTDQIISDIFELEDYRLNETRIMLAGFPSDAIVRTNLKIYDYAIGLTPNVAYWEDWNGLTNCRRMYLLNYYGIEGGYFSKHEYKVIIESEEFERMPIWPQKGSVKMFDNMAVVKLSDTPPLKSEK